jgi:hypothetical protein
MSRQDIDFKIGADLKQFRSAMGNIDHSLKRLSGGFGALGGMIGASFAVDAIKQFATESVELANQAEGVKRAFDRLNDDKLLDNLREATAGTVDDLKLMQTAVKAKNFRIPMDVLAKGLEFAQRRAQETGESVDYMVDSFVTGLGRKSVMILDNLGISAAELKEKMAAGGSMAYAVGQIMDESFAEAGERIETVSMKIDSQRATITNLKIAVGEQLAPVYEEFLDSTISQLKTVNLLLREDVDLNEKFINVIKSYLAVQSKQETNLGKIVSLTAKYLELERLVGEAQKENEVTLEDYRKAQEEYEADRKRAQAEELKILQDYQDKLGEVQLKIRDVHYKMNKLFDPSAFDGGLLAKQLGFDEVNMELEEIAETAEESSFVFDHSFRKMVETLAKYRDEVMLVGAIVKRSFEAAFVPLDELEEGETRIERFKEVFVDQMAQMAAALLATAAAALVLSLILSSIFGTGKAGLALFGKSGMGFGDLFKGIFGGIGGMSGFGFNNGLGGNQQGGGIQIFGRLSGSDILISSEKANRERSRYTFG